jgi:hypothetical protein
LGKVTPLRGWPERKLIDEEVSVNLVAERMLLAVSTLKAVRRVPTEGG